jgi:hypothetical protein
MMLALIILRTARATEATSAGELQIQSDSAERYLRGILPLQAAEDSDVNRGLAS